MRKHVCKCNFNWYTRVNDNANNRSNMTFYRIVESTLNYYHN